MDANDQFLSGYRATKPLILLNAKSSVVAEGQKVVNANKSKSLFTRQLLGDIPAGFVNSERVAYTGVSSSVVIGSVVADDRLRKNKLDAVDTYLKEHPNSNYTRAELYNKLRAKGGRYYVYGAKK